MNTQRDGLHKDPQKLTLSLVNICICTEVGGN